jgi:hypothetical protein
VRARGVQAGAGAAARGGLALWHCCWPYGALPAPSCRLNQAGRQASTQAPTCGDALDVQAPPRRAHLPHVDDVDHAGGGRLRGRGQGRRGVSVGTCLGASAHTCAGTRAGWQQPQCNGGHSAVQPWALTGSRHSQAAWLLLPGARKWRGKGTGMGAEGATPGKCGCFSFPHRSGLVPLAPVVGEPSGG